MFGKKNKNMVEQEESKMTPPEDFGAETELNLEEQEAMEAMRKFTDEDEDDLGEISVKSILGGDFLMSKFMVKQIMFVMFCVLLMILYTGNRYDSQQDTILIDSLRGRLQEVKYNVLTQSSELMNLTRQSNVEKVLKGTPDSLLHNSITPPYLIKVGKANEKKDEKEIEEVLVDTATKHVEEALEEEEEQQEQPKAETQTSAVEAKSGDEGTKNEQMEPEKKQEQ